jgi:hypothetical protein
MEKAMSEEGHEENRQKDRHQDLKGNFLNAFGAHGHMPQEAAVCVKKIIAHQSTLSARRHFGLRATKRQTQEHRQECLCHQIKRNAG